MAMLYENERKPLQSHILNLTDRKRLSISGVEDVEAFDEETVALSTAGGGLTIHGSGLKINKLTLDGGELLVDMRVARGSASAWNTLRSGSAAGVSWAS